MQFRKYFFNSCFWISLMAIFVILFNFLLRQQFKRVYWSFLIFYFEISKVIVIDVNILTCNWKSCNFRIIWIYETIQYLCFSILICSSSIMFATPNINFNVTLKPNILVNPWGLINEHSWKYRICILLYFLPSPNV